MHNYQTAEIVKPTWFASFGNFSSYVGIGQIQGDKQ